METIKITDKNATPENIDAALNFPGVVFWEKTEKVHKARKEGFERMMLKIREQK